MFDPENIRDLATFNDPVQYPKGLDYVIINGELVLEHGHHTGALAGRFIGRPTE